jgi:hypothetical protein
MLLLNLLFLHGGPWGGPGGPGNGEMGHHFGFFPFFPFFPALFWIGLIVFFAIMRSGGGRWHRGSGRMTTPPAQPATEPATGPSWPDLDPAAPPAPAPKRKDDGIEMF